MKRIALAALAVLVAAAAETRAGSILPTIETASFGRGEIAKHYVEVSPGVYVAVKGSRERRQVRYARLTAAWSLDQKVTARENGFPESRYRDLTAGVLTEIWTYPSRDREYVFSADGRLVAERLR